MTDYINRLFELQDKNYAAFHAKLVPVPDKSTIIGVRSPDMKKLAKELKNDEGKLEFLNTLPHKYYEENSLHGSFISTISKDINVIFTYIDKFLPYVDNWATCDSLVGNMKIFAKYPDIVYKKILEYLKSDKPFTIRFGVVTLLSYFLDGNFDKSIIETLAQIKSEHYYVNMGIAWYYSFALIKQYDSTVGLFEKKTLSKFVQNKSIQKAIESYRISDETKQYLRSLKIN